MLAAPRALILRGDLVGRDVHLRLVRLDLDRLRLAPDRRPQLVPARPARAVERLGHRGPAAGAVERQLGGDAHRRATVPARRPLLAFCGPDLAPWGGFGPER